MHYLAISFVVLNALDLYLTLTFVGSGMATELNPIMAKVLTWPWYSILLFKIVLPAVLAYAVILTAGRVSKCSAYSVLSLLVAAEFGICVFNLAGVLL